MDRVSFLPAPVLAELGAALDAEEPRALELALGIELALHGTEPESWGRELLTLVAGRNLSAVAAEVRELLWQASGKYNGLALGSLVHVDVGNQDVLAMERSTADETLLLIYNLTARSQPVKLREYTGREGWDILNRVEFRFPPRAQLEGYEFLWLLIV
jgi:hypothetical protein